MGRVELGSFLDLGEKPFAEFARWVLPIPVERGGQ